MQKAIHATHLLGWSHSYRYFGGRACRAVQPSAPEFFLWAPPPLLVFASSPNLPWLSVESKITAQSSREPNIQEKLWLFWGVPDYPFEEHFTEFSFPPHPLFFFLNYSLLLLLHPPPMRLHHSPKRFLVILCPQFLWQVILDAKICMSLFLNFCVCLSICLKMISFN